MASQENKARRKYICQRLMELALTSHVRKLDPVEIREEMDLSEELKNLKD